MRWSEWFFKENTIEMLCEWDSGLSIALQRSSELYGRCFFQRQLNPGMESRGPYMLQAVQAFGVPIGGPICKQASIQRILIPQVRPFRLKRIQEICIEEGMTKGIKVCLSIPKIFSWPW